MEKRNINLDVLKVLACFSVIFLHSTGIIVNNINSHYTINHLLYYSSVLAVPVFFMVNGFLLLNRKSMKYEYVLRKIVTIIMVIFSWNLIWGVLKFIGSKKINNPITESIKCLIQKGYFWQFWFFGALIIIYMVLPIIFKYFQNIRTAITITLTFIMFSLIVDVASICRSLIGQSVIQLNVPQVFRLWTWFSYYLLGGLIGKEEVRNYIFAKISKRLNAIILILSLIVVNIYQYVVGRTLFNTTYAEYYYDNIFVFIFVISLFVFTLRINFRKNSIIDLCSKNIMGIYILHVVILNACNHIYKFNTSITNILLIFIVFISSLVISEVISRLPIVNKLIKL